MLHKVSAGGEHTYAAAAGCCCWPYAAGQKSEADDATEDKGGGRGGEGREVGGGGGGGDGGAVAVDVATELHHPATNLGRSSGRTAAPQLAQDKHHIATRTARSLHTHPGPTSRGTRHLLHILCISSSLRIHLLLLHVRRITPTVTGQIVTKNQCTKKKASRTLQNQRTPQPV